MGMVTYIVFLPVGGPVNKYRTDYGITHLENLHETCNIQLCVQGKVMYICDECGVTGALFFEKAELFFKGI
jgi:hypothetical protein